jgi:hypothetical protein
MKKTLMVVVALAGAAGVLYLSRTSQQPTDQQVQGAIGAKRLSRGATVCVNKLGNTSGKEIDMEGVEEALADQLEQVGFRSNVGGGDCEGSVFGEITAVKGKDRVEAEVDFRLVLKGDQTPMISSTAKGKSGEADKSRSMAMSFVGKSRKEGAAATREALLAAFAGVARQIEEQRPRARSGE